MVRACVCACVSASWWWTRQTPSPSSLSLPAIQLRGGGRGGRVHAGPRRPRRHPRRRRPRSKLAPGIRVECAGPSIRVVFSRVVSAPLHKLAPGIRVGRVCGRYRSKLAPLSHQRRWGAWLRGRGGARALLCRTMKDTERESREESLNVPRGCRCAFLPDNERYRERITRREFEWTEGVQVRFFAGASLSDEQVPFPVPSVHPPPSPPSFPRSIPPSPRLPPFSICPSALIFCPSLLAGPIPWEVPVFSRYTEPGCSMT